MEVVKGPSWDPERNEEVRVEVGRRHCGAERVDAAFNALTSVMQNVRRDDDVVCEGLTCRHGALGEWDSEWEVRFARRGEGVVVAAVMIVLDVPMRTGADEDLGWARGKMESLLRATCP